MKVVVEGTYSLELEKYVVDFFKDNWSGTEVIGGTPKALFVDSIVNGCQKFNGSIYSR